MSGALHMLGAGDGLKDQFIVVKVNHVDGELLKRKLAESRQSGAIAPLAMMVVDHAPPEVINAALPMAERELTKYGIFASLKLGEDPLANAKTSRFFPGFVVGGGLVAAVAAIGYGTWKLLLKRLFT